MKKERMIEELARIEGFTFTEKMEHNTYPYGWTVRVKTWFDRLNNEVHCSDLPDYLNDHNACQRIIEVMGLKELIAYERELYTLLPRDKASGVFMHQSKPPKKCAAILKAYGKYDEECE